MAWTNGIFQREYLRQPLDWCVHCHAPLVDTDLPGPLVISEVAAQGVNCLVCHVRDGEVLSGSRAPTSPHPTRVVPGFGDASFCAGCHQFNFPVVADDGSVTTYTEHPMQKTVAEFRAGPYAGQAGECLGCHGLSGHRYPGGHAPEAVTAAVALTTCRAERGAVHVIVKNVGAGHMIPTGDLHRHFLLRVWRSTAPTSMFEGFIGRAFEPAADGGKQVRVDTSIAPREARTYDVPYRSLGGADDEPVNVELRYVYTPDEVPTARNDPGEPTFLVVDHQRFAPGGLDRCTPGS